MRGRKHRDWSGRIDQCAYCLGPNDRAHEVNRNGLPPTRCSRCKRDFAPVPQMGDAERERIAAMLARPTWEAVR